MTPWDSKTITVAIARFEDLVGAGLRAEVEADSRYRLVASDIVSSMLNDVLTEQEPDLLVVDLAELRPPAQIQQLRRDHPETQIVVLAQSQGDASRLVALGAAACTTKDTPGPQVLAMLALVASGLRLLPQADQSDRDADGNHDPGLTAREREVMQLLREGRSNAEIALRLHIALETVKTHVKHILCKYGVRSRQELRSGDVGLMRRPS